MEMNFGLADIFGDLDDIDDEPADDASMDAISPGLPLSWGPSDETLNLPETMSGGEGEWECVGDDDTAADMSLGRMDDLDSDSHQQDPVEVPITLQPDIQTATLMHDDLSQHLAVHLARSQAKAMPKQPWETSVVYNVFKPRFLDSMSYRTLGRAETALGAVASGSAFVPHSTVASPPDFVKRRLKLASLAQSDDHMRKGALLKAWALLLVDPLTTQLGNSLLSSAGSLVDETVIVQSFADAFAPKTTSTLVKRMSSLWRYGKWCMDNHLSPFNMKEDQVYRYLTQLRDAGSAPSAAESFIEAIHFLHPIVFIKCFGEGVTVSGRCKGLAKSELRRKRKRRQAPPLTVAMVRAMEKFVMENYTDHRGVICGHLLFCIYSCARWSDTLRLVEIQKFHRGTVTLLETATEHHKSALTDDAKSMFLPLLCLGQCLEQTPWATYWLNARTVGKIGRPWMDTAQPGWDDRKGKFTSSYMSSTEATIWLQEILELSGVNKEVAAAYTSHSCKSTLLSWAAKSGLFTPSQRRRLGHHMDPQDKSMLVYSRDSFADLAVATKQMFNKINEGKFHPDKSRVERISEQVDGNRDDESSSSSSSETSESEPEPPSPSTRLKHPEDEASKPPRDFDDVSPEHLMVHKLSGVVHIVEHGDFLVCGRPVTSNYVRWMDANLETEDSAPCAQCARGLDDL